VTVRDPRSATSFSRGLAILTAAGLAVRIAFLLLEPHADLAGDESTWTALALKGVVLRRHSFSPLKSPLIFYPPAYPYFIAAGYAWLGSLEAVRWTQAILGALLVPAVGRVGALAFSPAAGLLAAGVAAFYPELVWFSVHFWSETLFLVLLWWAFERVLSCHSSGRVGAAAAAGMLWGLAVLTRETVLYFAPLVGLWLAWPRGGEGRPAGFRPALGASFLAAAILTVAPWTYRNWVVFHAFVPVSTFGAHSLWQGNTRLPLDEFYRQTDSVPGPIPQYRLAWGRAWEAIRERQPEWLLEKLRVEMPEFWAPESHVFVLIDRDAYGPVGQGVRRLVRAVTVLPYLAVLILAIPGLAALRLTAARGLLLLFLVYYNGLHVLTYGQDRFRLPVMPVLFLVAGQAFLHWRAGTFPALAPWRRALLCALVLAAVAVLLPGFLREG
jgi:dolichyl-phosphate-mannose-protein mannosyltransferase